MVLDNILLCILWPGVMVHEWFYFSKQDSLCLPCLGDKASYTFEVSPLTCHLGHAIHKLWTPTSSRLPPAPGCSQRQPSGACPHHLGPNSHLGFGPAASVAPTYSGPSLSPLGTGGFLPQASVGFDCLLRPLSVTAFLALHLATSSTCNLQSPIKLNLKHVPCAGG